MKNRAPFRGPGSFMAAEALLQNALLAGFQQLGEQFGRVLF